MLGLRAFGRALGQRVAVADVAADYTDEVERVVSYGYEHVYRCPSEVGITDLAEQAGAKALATAGLDADAVDLIVLAVTDLTEYLYWDAAAALQRRLGAIRAEAVLMTQACTSGVVCLDTVAGRFATHPDYQTALVVAANRTSEQYWNRLDTQPLLFSDGAAAVVAARDHHELRWRGTETATDGRWADFFRMDLGGAARPFPPDVAVPRDELRTRDAWSIMEDFDYDAERFGAFMHELDARARLVIERACRRAGRAVTDLSRLLFTHDTALAYESLCAELGLPAERTNLAMASEHGHLGAADQLHDLAAYQEAGELRQGDLIALAGRGRGMHWACSLIEV
jgi:3-oxoacyl-[acyl-carrier-protein] synthase-3